MKTIFQKMNEERVRFGVPMKQYNEAKSRVNELIKIYNKMLDNHKKEIRDFLKRHGFTAKEMIRRKNNKGLFEKFWREQDKACAICRVAFTSHERINMDHCHFTGKWRGLLCTRCNLGLGMFLDKPSLLHEAADYIIKHRPYEAESIEED